MLLGIVAVLLLLGIFIFGPWELPGFGQLSQRQIDQAISAAEVQSPTIPPGDSDQDGFTDEVERWIHTDAADNCADDTNDAAWPPDFNNDKLVNMTDVVLLKPYFGQKVTGEKNKRFDLNADKVINLSDVFLLRNFFDKGCPYYFMSNPRTEGPNVLFNWSPATEAPILFAAIDLTKSGQSDCNSTQAFQSSAFTTTINTGQQAFGWSSGEPGHNYCAALLLMDGTSYQYLVSNAVNFRIPSPDLTITELTTNKDYYSVGERVYLSITIRNIGPTLAKGPFVTNYRTTEYRGCGLEGSQEAWSTSTLAPGQSQRFQGSFILESAEQSSTGTIYATVDAACRVIELNEGNNISTKVFKIMYLVPGAPTEVKAEAISCNQIKVSWKDSSPYERGFRIEARDARANNFNVIGEVQSSTSVGATREYVWNTAPLGIRFIFRVGAYNDAGINYGYFDNYVIPTNCPQTSP